MINTWTDSYLVHYAQAVADAGGIPVQLPREALPAELAECLDGLVIAGGHDVDPRCYGELPTADSTQLDPERDAFELDLIVAALDLERPLVGICRGAQLVNVARGGTLTGDLRIASADGGREEHGVLRYPAGARVHEVRFARGSLMHAIYGERTSVNSFHRQAIRTRGAGVVVSGVAPDGVVEAIEVGERALGVQWHPELLPGQDPLFRWLIEAAVLARPSPVRSD